MENKINSEKWKNRELLKGFLIYSIGSFGSKILSFLLVPLYTYYIVAEDMGTYDLLNTTIGLLTPIITMQISDAAYRWMIREEGGDKSRYVRATLQVLLFNSAIAVVLIFAVNRFIAIPYCGYFVSALITARMLATIQRLLRGMKNQRLYALSGVVYTAIYLALNILQICVLKMGIESLFISMVCSDLVSILLILLREKRFRVSVFHRPEIPLIRKMLAFSIPLVPNQLNWWIINSSNKYVIGLFLGLSANGVYSIAYKFPSFLQMIFNLFNTSWQDVSIADLEEETGVYYTKVFRSLYKFYFSILWCLAPVTKVFIAIALSETYKSASNYVPILYLSAVFQAFSSFYGVGYLRSKETKRAATTSIYGAVVNLVMGIIFIHFLGLYAAALSSLLGFFVMWIMRAWQNRKELEIQIEWKIFLPVCISAVLLCGVTSVTGIYADAILSVLGTIAFAAYNRSYICKILQKLKSHI